MEDTQGHRALLRVEHGSADEVELAALTVVLFRVLALRDEASDDDGQGDARWRRLERTAAYRAPHSWQ
ncbi:acyl-CoA carboxylase subunit epsilon [Streptomyces monticola]|uniref:Acyl-CoA carboxylase subunit epsilon n=1 Tax=Streptomyces monticola TaxID=2666263 RepID=A0ABW2JX06_9ACTN